MEANKSTTLLLYGKSTNQPFRTFAAIRRLTASSHLHLHFLNIVLQNTNIQSCIILMHLLLYGQTLPLCLHLGQYNNSFPPPWIRHVGFEPAQWVLASSAACTALVLLSALSESGTGQHIDIPYPTVYLRYAMQRIAKCL